MKSGYRSNYSTLFDTSTLRHQEFRHSTPRFRHFDTLISTLLHVQEREGELYFLFSLHLLKIFLCELCFRTITDKINLLFAIFTSYTYKCRKVSTSQTSTEISMKNAFIQNFKFQNFIIINLEIQSLKTISFLEFRSLSSKDVQLH